MLAAPPPPHLKKKISQTFVLSSAEVEVVCLTFIDTLIRVSWPQITQSQLTIDLSALSATLDHRVIFSVNCCWALLPATSLASACPLKLFSVVMHRWLICVRISAMQACLCPVLVPPWTSIKYLGITSDAAFFFSLIAECISMSLISYLRTSKYTSW